MGQPNSVLPLQEEKKEQKYKVKIEATLPADNDINEDTLEAFKNQLIDDYKAEGAEDITVIITKL